MTVVIADTSARRVLAQKTSLTYTTAGPAPRRYEGGTTMRLFTMVLAGALGLSTAGALAQLAADMKLEDAGFVMRKADSAEKLVHVKRLPPRKFVSRVKNGQTYYVYADPELCQCVFVGNAVAFEAYRDMRKRLPQPDKVPGAGLNPTDIVATQMDSDLSDMIENDNILDWRF